MQPHVLSPLYVCKGQDRPRLNSQFEILRCDRTPSPQLDLKTVRSFEGPKWIPVESCGNCSASIRSGHQASPCAAERRAFDGAIGNRMGSLDGECDEDAYTWWIPMAKNISRRSPSDCFLFELIGGSNQTSQGSITKTSQSRRGPGERRGIVGFPGSLQIGSSTIL